jgi:hypothetical protein
VFRIIGRGAPPADPSLQGPSLDEAFRRRPFTDPRFSSTPPERAGVADRGCGLSGSVDAFGSERLTSVFRKGGCRWRGT